MDSWKSVPLDEVSYRPRNFEIGNDQFAVLEQAFGRPIETAARESLIKIIVGYLDDRSAQKSTETWGDVANHLDGFVAVASALWTYSYKGRKSGVAYRRFRELLTKAIVSDPVRVNLERDELIVHTNFGPRTFRSLSVPAPPGGFSIAPSEQMLRRMALTLVNAATRIRADIIESASASAVEDNMSELDMFFVRLAKWAKMSDLPYGPYVDGQFPSPFSEFVLQLISLLPTDLRNPIKLDSAAAIARRIKRAKHDFARREKDQFNSRVSGPYGPSGTNEET